MKRDDGTTIRLSAVRRRALVLGAALALGAPAHAQTTNIQDLLSYIQDLKKWVTTITDLGKLKDDILNNANWKDLAMNLLNQGLNSGINIAGVDLSGIVKNVTAFQAKVDEIRAQIINVARGKIAGGFFDPEKRAEYAGNVGLAPDLAVQKVESAVETAQALELQANQVQRNADAVKVQAQSQETVKQTQDRAQDTVANSAKLVQAGVNATSTREAVQVLVRALAETNAAQALNASAITTSIAQSVKAQGVIAANTDALVQDTIRQRVGAAKANQRSIEAEREDAIAMGQRLGGTADAAADAMRFTMQEIDVDEDVLYGN